MADLVVKDLQNLVNDLNSLISQFEGALDFQNDDKGLWDSSTPICPWATSPTTGPSTATRWSRT